MRKNSKTRINLSSDVLFHAQKHATERSPACGNKNDDSDDDCSANSGTGRYGDLVHVRCLRCNRAHLAALLIRHIFWRHGDVFERNHTHDDALLRRDVLYLELTFSGLERRALLEAFVAEEPINDTKAENVRRVRVPLDDDRVVLPAEHHLANVTLASR